MTKYHGVWGALAYGAGTFALVIAGAGCGARTGVSLTQGEPNADRGGSGGAQTSGGEAAHAGSFGSGGHVDRICGAVIDDLEDGTGRICQSVDGRQGAWYAFHDNTADGMQWPAKTAPGTPILPSLVDGRGAASRRAMHTYGDHFSDWGSGIGFDLNFDGTTYRTYDARAYYGVGFWARTNYESSGYSYQRLRFRVSTAPTTAPAYGGTCAQANCAGPRGLELQTSPLWRHYEVSFDELAIIDKQHQIDTDLERLTNVQFMTSRSTSGSTTSCSWKRRRRAARPFPRARAAYTSPTRGSRKPRRPTADRR